MNGKAEAGKNLHCHYSALRLSLKGKHRNEKCNYPEALSNNLTGIARFYSISNFKHIYILFDNIIFYIIKQNPKKVNTFSPKCVKKTKKQKHMKNQEKMRKNEI